MIYKATKKNVHHVAEMASIMWKNHDIENLVKELETVITSEDGVIYIYSEDAQIIGFAQCQLRHDYVEGTHSSPVGYLEGIFVKEDYRKRGIAKKLLQACEQWSKEKGCTEFASDCELSNINSCNFHKAMNFEEANKIICFTKKL